MSRRESIGIGIIGTGFARTTQLPAFRAVEGARVAAIASGHRENAERVAREFDIPFVASDWREVVERDDVDLVSIVTPPSTHAEIATAALEAGKAVLCEKPMALNADETDAMRQKARAAGRLALIDHELRFLPARRLMREMILSGEIGRVRHAKFVLRSDSRAAADRPWNWWSDERAGGGALGAIGSHAVDALRWLLFTGVAHVSATLAAHVRERLEPSTGEPRAVTSDDEASLLLNFDDGAVTDKATGIVSISMVEAGATEHSVAVFGSEGALRVEGASDLWQSRVGDNSWQRVSTDGAPLASGLRDGEWSRGFTVFAREIVAALRDGRTTIDGAATFDDGHHTQLVLDAARAAHSSGCRVAVTDV
ncbi:MAG TPA: Gfo/Idh/MocA family oxidoreductase [Pyrinomonadaceae bacterium]|nr:Gfo/Idh/MocA family oxidoreductase [Pyrinomonadaceae bacterium]